MPFLCFPLPVWLGPLLHNSPVQNGILFKQELLLGQLSLTRSGEMQKLLSFKWSNRWLLPPPSIAAVLISLAPYGLAAALILPTAPKNLSGQECRQFGCVQSQCFSLWRNKVLLKQWDQLPSFLRLEIDTLATLACTCKYEQTLELFFTSCIIE